MKETIRFQILDSLRRLRNAEEKACQIRTKIEKLQKELEILDKKVSQEENFIVEIGKKSPSREAGKPDSEKELQSKNSFNEKLQKEKAELLKNSLSSENFEESSDSSPFAKAISRMSGRL
jgi:predicted  nucleic acid-binding Zn-ribbon protein